MTNKRQVNFLIYPLYALQKVGCLKAMQNEVGDLTRNMKHTTRRHKINIKI